MVTLFQRLNITIITGYIQTVAAIAEVAVFCKTYIRLKIRLLFFLNDIKFATTTATTATREAETIYGKTAREEKNTRSNVFSSLEDFVRRSTYRNGEPA